MWKQEILPIYFTGIFMEEKGKKVKVKLSNLSVGQARRFPDV